MIQSSGLTRSNDLGKVAAVFLGFALVAFMAIAFSEGVLPVRSSAARLGGEGFSWSQLR